MKIYKLILAFIIITNLIVESLQELDSKIHNVAELMTPKLNIKLINEEKLDEKVNLIAKGLIGFDECKNGKKNKIIRKRVQHNNKEEYLLKTIELFAVFEEAKNYFERAENTNAKFLLNNIAKSLCGVALIQHILGLTKRSAEEKLAFVNGLIADLQELKKKQKLLLQITDKNVIKELVKLKISDIEGKETDGMQNERKQIGNLKNDNTTTFSDKQNENTNAMVNANINKNQNENLEAAKNKETHFRILQYSKKDTTGADIFEPPVNVKIIEPKCGLARENYSKGTFVLKWTEECMKGISENVKFSIEYTTSKPANGSLENIKHHVDMKFEKSKLEESKNVEIFVHESDVMNIKFDGQIKAKMLDTKLSGIKEESMEGTHDEIKIDKKGSFKNTKSIKVDAISGKTGVDGGKVSVINGTFKKSEEIKDEISGKQKTETFSKTKKVDAKISQKELANQIAKNLIKFGQCQNITNRAIQKNQNNFFLNIDELQNALLKKEANDCALKLSNPKIELTDSKNIEKLRKNLTELIEMQQIFLRITDQQLRKNLAKRKSKLKMAPIKQSKTKDLKGKKERKSLEASKTVNGVNPLDEKHSEGSQVKEKHSEGSPLTVSHSPKTGNGEHNNQIPMNLNSESNKGNFHELKNFEMENTDEIPSIKLHENEIHRETLEKIIEHSNSKHEKKDSVLEEHVPSKVMDKLNKMEEKENLLNLKTEIPETETSKELKGNDKGHKHNEELSSNTGENQNGAEMTSQEKLEEKGTLGKTETKHEIVTQKVEESGIEKHIGKDAGIHSNGTELKGNVGEIGKNESEIHVEEKVHSVKHSSQYSNADSKGINEIGADISGIKHAKHEPIVGIESSATPKDGKHSQEMEHDGAEIQMEEIVLKGTDSHLKNEKTKMANENPTSKIASGEVNPSGRNIHKTHSNETAEEINSKGIESKGNEKKKKISKNEENIHSIAHRIAADGNSEEMPSEIIELTMKEIGKSNRTENSKGNGAQIVKSPNNGASASFINSWLSPYIPFSKKAKKEDDQNVNKQIEENGPKGGITKFFIFSGQNTPENRKEVMEVKILPMKKNKNGKLEENKPKNWKECYGEILDQNTKLKGIFKVDWAKCGLTNEFWNSSEMAVLQMLISIREPSAEIRQYYEVNFSKELKIDTNDKEEQREKLRKLVEGKNLIEIDVKKVKKANVKECLMEKRCVNSSVQRVGQWWKKTFFR